jgi:hypothetical protein
MAACAALVAITSLLSAAAAQANTVTLGSQFQGEMIGGLLDGGKGTLVNTSLPAPLVAGAPSDGTVTAWRFSGDTGDPFVPQIVHPLGGGLYTETARGPAQQGLGVGTIAGPFPVELPVVKGDLIGVIGTSFTLLGVFTDRPNSPNGYFVPELSPGPGRAPDFGGPDTEQAISATLRYCLVPSLRGMKPKAAKQALKAADCTFGGKSKSKKRRKKKKVVNQTVAPGTSISDTAPVAIRVSRPKRKK